MPQNMAVQMTSAVKREEGRESGRKRRENEIEMESERESDRTILPHKMGSDRKGSTLY